jgi:hypothetical protein
MPSCAEWRYIEGEGEFCARYNEEPHEYVPRNYTEAPPRVYSAPAPFELPADAAQALFFLLVLLIVYLTVLLLQGSSLYIVCFVRTLPRAPPRAAPPTLANFLLASCAPGALAWPGAP